MKRLLVLFLLTTSICSTQAADKGITAANFLKVGVGPRAVAMGEAQVGLADDVYATYWNPAGLAQLQVQEAGFAQQQHLEGISEQFAGYAYPRPSLGTLAGSFSYLSVGKFQGYDATGQPTARVGASDAALTLSHARTYFRDRRFGSGLSLGLTAKYIQQQLDTARARAYAGDMGLLWVPGKKWGDMLDGWKAGLVFRNLGTAIRFDQEAFDLPRSVDAGVSYGGRWRDESITLAMDGRQPEAGTSSYGVGLEVHTLQYLLVRLGYTTAGDLGNGLRMGGGLRFKTIQVDYAYAGAGDFGATHRIGMTLRFGKLPQDPQYVAQRWYEKGLKNHRDRRFSEALVDFNKALEIDPEHPDALKMMQQTYDELKIILPE